MNNKKLYICHTPYQVFITLIKKFNDSSNVDLVICNTIPNCDYLIKNIREKNIFQKEKIAKKKFRTNEMIHLFEKNSDINILQYDDIYIYNDWTTFGAYLMDKKIYYHLIEDGYNGLYYMKENFKDRITFLNPNFMYYVKKIIKKILHIEYDYFGQSKYVIDIEVNDLTLVPKQFKKKKLVEVSKRKLYESINESQKQEIYNIFVNNKIAKSKGNLKKNLLLLTQPLYKDGMVKSLLVQVSVYKSIINEFIKDYNITIKAHPRDDYDYQKLNPNINIIDRTIPIELLNFNHDVVFDLAVTIKSSSIKSLENIKNKKELGLEYLEKF